MFRTTPNFIPCLPMNRTLSLVPLGGLLLLALLACGDSAPKEEPGGPEGGQDAGPDTAPDPEDADGNNDPNNDQPDAEPNNDPNNDQPDADTPDADQPDAPVTEAPVRSCAQELVFQGAAQQGVAVAGSFNGWDTAVTPMTFRDGAWRVELELPAGNYPFKFVVDGQYEGQPPATAYTQWEDGVENRSLRMADCQRPTFRAVEVAFGPDGTLTGHFQFERATGGAALDAESVTATVGGQPAQVQVDARSGQVTIDFQAPEYGKYSIELRGADVDGATIEEGVRYLPLWHEAEPFDWRDATMYLIFTDRFRDTDGVNRRIEGVEERANYQGGDFRGITRAIEEGYFERLGVNALWLSPVYDNTDNGYRDKRDSSKIMSGFHGYWPISLDPEPRYGDDEADARERLRELTRVAHAHGIRVLFDLALNHVHEDHPYCQENPQWCSRTCECGGPGCGWDPSERGIDCQFDYFLPDLSYRNHDIVTRVMDDTLDMIRQYDVDGLRIDAARHMDHVIMRTLRMTLRDTIEAQGGAEYYLVGETFTDDRGQIMEYVGPTELHGQFDFAMRSSIRWVMGGGGSFRDLDAAAEASESPGGYGDAVWYMSPFFGNHDMERFATVLARNDGGPWGDTPDLMALGGDDEVTQWDIINRMSMSFAFLLAYKGIPLLYYGDEIGLAGSHDPDNRRMMIWEHNANHRTLLERAQTLGQARRQLRALRRGERQQLWFDDDLYVFIRSEVAGQGAIIAMNKGGATRTESVHVPPEYGLEGRTLESFNSDRTVTVTDNTIQVTLNPWEYAIFH